LASVKSAHFQSNFPITFLKTKERILNKKIIPAGLKVTNETASQVLQRRQPKTAKPANAKKVLRKGKKTASSRNPTYPDKFPTLGKKVQ